MLKEMHEQPVAVRSAIAGRIHESSIRVPELDDLVERIVAADRVEFVACGSASYAAIVGATAIQAWAGLPARATVGSEFRYTPPPLDAPDPRHRRHPVGRDGRHLAPTRYARQQGCAVIAVTNTVGSAITRDAMPSSSCRRAPRSRSPPRRPS